MFIQLSVIVFVLCSVNSIYCEVSDLRAISDQSIKATFAQLDTDHDGRLTPGEMKSLFDDNIDLSKAEVFFYDFDRDGSLNEEEFILRHRLEGDERSFAEIVDKNKDGMVSREELAQTYRDAGITNENFIKVLVDYSFRKAELGPGESISKKAIGKGSYSIENTVSLVEPSSQQLCQSCTIHRESKDTHPVHCPAPAMATAFFLNHTDNL